MNELTTGVLFLMSSVFGSGQAESQVASIAKIETASDANNSLTITVSDTIDPKKMEIYLRDEFAETPLLVEIARCESNFKQFDPDGNLIKGRVDPADIGVMQINTRYHAETAAKLGHDLKSVEGNIAYAKYLYAKEGSKPWNASSKCWSVSQSVAKI